MSEALDTARRMLARTGEHPVVSMYFDLDPSEFATPPARATQARSLLDEASRTTRGDKSLPHEDRVALGEDLDRIEAFFSSDEAPVSGARALAVFSSRQDQLFESVRMSEVVEPRVVIERTPYVEPLVAGPDPGRWCVVLANRRLGRIFDGGPDQLAEVDDIKDNVRGQPHGGGLSQANYQRSAEEDARAHLRRVAADLYRRWQQQPFQKLVLGGPVEDAARLGGELHNDLRPTLVDTRLDLDVDTATETDLQDAVAPLVAAKRQADERWAVSELTTRRASLGTRRGRRRRHARGAHRTEGADAALGPRFSGPGGSLPGLRAADR